MQINVQDDECRTTIKCEAKVKLWGVGNELKGKNEYNKSDETKNHLTVTEVGC